MTLKIAVVYVAFFAMVAVAVWVTKSAMPFWALLLIPSVEVKR